MSFLESKQNISTLIPQSLLNDVSCFVMSDDHPLDTPFDIVICTTQREVIEISNRQVVATVRLEDSLIPEEIKIYRNANNKKYYLVSTFENLYIISARPNFTVHKHIKNVERYSIDDIHCIGMAQVRIWSIEDALPSVLNENFEFAHYGEAETIINESSFVSTLKSKLTESRHIVNVNEARYRELCRFRQESLHAITLDMCPNDTNSSFRSCEAKHTAMTVKNMIPWLKLCNGKVVIGVAVSNEASTSMTDIKLILQSNTSNPVAYKTDTYSTIPEPPYWVKIPNRQLDPNQNGVVIAVTEIEEFVCENVITYSSVIIYEIDGKQKFVPVEEIKLSCLETMKESFDVLSSNNFDPQTFVSILSTTHSIKLNVRHVNTSARDLPDIEEMFKDYMNMDRVCNSVLIHRTAPWHVLNGVMIILNEAFTNEEYEIIVHLRSKSQLSSLLHLMFDAIPYRLLITTPEISVTLRNATPMDTSCTEVNQSFKELEASKLELLKESLLRQTKMILEYFDECMTAMAASRSTAVGTEIDLKAPGTSRFHQFTEQVYEQIETTGKLLKI